MDALRRTAARIAEMLSALWELLPRPCARRW